MKGLSHYFSKYKKVIILMATWMVATLLVNPMGDIPLNDDWQSAIAVLQ
jgi:hypothetical protein